MSPFSPFRLHTLGSTYKQRIDAHILVDGKRVLPGFRADPSQIRLPEQIHDVAIYPGEHPLGIREGSHLPEADRGSGGEHRLFLTVQEVRPVDLHLLHTIIVSV